MTQLATDSMAPTYLSLSTFQMVRVSAGSFQMGSDTETAYGDEQPVHEVAVNAFELGRFPVTQEVWQLVMADTDLANPSYFSGEHHPVERVSWDDVQQFLERLNQLPDIVELNEQDGKRFRLPTEAQWEYAARGGADQQSFSYSGSNKLKEVAWYIRNSHNSTKPVGLKQSNSLGLYDMSGNVWEWCADHWHENYEGAPLDGSAWTEGGEDNLRRVVRGGSWYYDDLICRVSYRFRFSSKFRNDDIGFRLARY